MEVTLRTFHQHLRNAQRAVFGALFGEGPQWETVSGVADPRRGRTDAGTTCVDPHPSGRDLHPARLHGELHADVAGLATLLHEGGEDRVECFEVYPFVQRFHRRRIHTGIRRQSGHDRLARRFVGAERVVGLEV
jgi:hypothetical protein